MRTSLALGLRGAGLTRGGPTRAGLVSAGLALLAGMALGAAAILAAPDPRGLPALAAAAGLVALGGGLALGRARPLPVGLALLGTSYVVAVLGRPAGLDPLAPAFGAGLLLVAELAYWSLDLRAPGWRDPGLRRRQAVRVAALVGAAFLLDVCVVLGAALGGLAGGGLPLSLLGMAAAVGTLGLAGALAWRRATS
jgi:hypothetical protein